VIKKNVLKKHLPNKPKAFTPKEINLQKDSLFLMLHSKQTAIVFPLFRNHWLAVVYEFGLFY